MAVFLTPDDYPAIRALLNVEFDEVQLPDGLIERDIFLPAAEQDVLDRYPEAEADADNAERVRRAAMCFCAARLAVPSVPAFETSLRVSARDMDFITLKLDMEKRAAELRALAEAELAVILEPADETPNQPVMFTVARGYRGR